MKRITRFSIICFSLFAAVSAYAVDTPSDKSPQNDLPTIYIVGDSTVHNTGKGLAGWGDVIAPGFDLTKINVKNVAIGGRSSRSYIEEGRWQTAVMDQLKPGDFVLIQFGHNDGGGFTDPKGAYRATIRGMGDETRPWTDPKTGTTVTVHTFGYYMQQYARDVKSRAATPIFLSLVPRNDWTEDGKSVLRARPGYAEWTEQAAKAGRAIFIDLNEISAKKLDAIGKDNTIPKYFPFEHTHTSPVAALMNAQSVLDGLRALGRRNPLRKYMLPGQIPSSIVSAPIVDAPGAPKEQPEAPTATK